MRNFQPRPPQRDDIWNIQLPIDDPWGIYARQSSAGQLMNNIQSTEMQTDDLIAWLVQRQVKPEQISLFDADLGISGTLRIDERTGLQKLVARIEQDAIKAVLVYQVSRLFRDETGVQYNVFATICKEHHCLLVTSDGMVFNFNNPMHLKMFRYLAEMAAEYIPQHVKGVLLAARMRKARKGLYAGLGPVASGYIVDYRKGSPTFEKLIPYRPHSEVVFSFLERYYGLCGDMNQLCRELDKKPYLFPPFEAWVDQRNIARWKKREVPGGYTLSRKGLEQLLTNPVYLGWWIVEGDVISRENHESIIDKEHEYLFWCAFDRLSNFTVEGEINEKRDDVRGPRRFYQQHTNDNIALLKHRIASPDGFTYVHVNQGKSRYAIIPITPTMLKTGSKEIDTTIIDTAFTDHFFARLRETHGLEVYKQWVTEETQKQASLMTNIHRQLQQIALQQKAILTEIVAIHKQIAERACSEEEKKQLEKEAEPMLAVHRGDFIDLEKLKKELTAKLPKPEQNQAPQTPRQYADFQTELEKLIAVWHRKPISVRREFVNLFVKEAVLTMASAHWVQLDILWAIPPWGCDTGYIHRQFGSRPPWTEEEQDILNRYYPTACREDVLALLPEKSWDSIKQQALLLGVERTVLTPCCIPRNVAWSDWCFMQEHGIPLGDTAPKWVSS